MKAIFFHANSFGFSVDSPSTRLGGTLPAEITDTNNCLVEECLAVLFHIEEADGERQVRRLCKDIKRIAKKVGAMRLMVAAFGHLSHSYAPPGIAMEVSKQVVETCRGWRWAEVHTSPFGYNKSLLLNCKGHPDAIKHRSY